MASARGGRGRREEPPFTPGPLHRPPGPRDGLGYNPLLDAHLKPFLRSRRMYHHLRRAGLVAEDGSIVGESQVRRNHLREQKKAKMREELTSQLATLVIDERRRIECQHQQRMETEGQRLRMQALKRSRANPMAGMEEEVVLELIKPPARPRRAGNKHRRRESVAKAHSLRPASSDTQARAHSSRGRSRTAAPSSRQGRPGRRRADLVTREHVSQFSGLLEQRQAKQLPTRLVIRYEGASFIRDVTDVYGQDVPVEMVVRQQPAGGASVVVFKGNVVRGEVFEFDSRRKEEHPFGVTVFANGLQLAKMSSCCEYRHAVGRYIGRKQGGLHLLGIQNGEPCLNCQLEQYVSSRSIRPSTRKTASSTGHRAASAATGAAGPSTDRSGEPLDDPFPLPTDGSGDQPEELEGAYSDGFYSDDDEAESEVGSEVGADGADGVGEEVGDGHHGAEMALKHAGEAMLGAGEVDGGAGTAPGEHRASLPYADEAALLAALAKDHEKNWVAPPADAAPPPHEPSDDGKGDVQANDVSDEQGQLQGGEAAEPEVDIPAPLPRTPRPPMGSPLAVRLGRSVRARASKPVKPPPTDPALSLGLGGRRQKGVEPWKLASPEVRDRVRACFRLWWVRTAAAAEERTATRAGLAHSLEERASKRLEHHHEHATAPTNGPPGLDEAAPTAVDEEAAEDEPPPVEQAEERGDEEGAAVEAADEDVPETPAEQQPDLGSVVDDLGAEAPSSPPPESQHRASVREEGQRVLERAETRLAAEAAEEAHLASCAPAAPSAEEPVAAPTDAMVAAADEGGEDAADREGVSDAVVAGFTGVVNRPFEDDGPTTSPEPDAGAGPEADASTGADVDGMVEEEEEAAAEGDHAEAEAEAALAQREEPGDTAGDEPPTPPPRSEADGPDPLMDSLLRSSLKGSRAVKISREVRVKFDERGHQEEQYEPVPWSEYETPERTSDDELDDFYSSAGSAPFAAAAPASRRSASSLASLTGLPPLKPL